MKKVIITDKFPQTINLENIDENDPIFALKKDKFVGMVIQDVDGWIVKLGGKTGAYGYYQDREECIIEGYNLGFDFFVE